MRDGHIGLIDTPRQRNATAGEILHAAGVPWCADNGCFSDKWDEAEWWAFLQRNAHRAATCLFAVAPDVVADAAATLERSTPWLPRIRALGYPVAFVAQDGLESLEVPWDDFDVLFVGGSTKWKLGPEAREIAREAKARGKRIHVGRVNSQRRYDYARTPYPHGLGADSCDGTTLTRAPDENLPKVISWGRLVNHPDLFSGATR